MICVIGTPAECSCPVKCCWGRVPLTGQGEEGWGGELAAVREGGGGGEGCWWGGESPHNWHWTYKSPLHSPLRQSSQYRAQGNQYSLFPAPTITRLSATSVTSSRPTTAVGIQFTCHLSNRFLLSGGSLLLGHLFFGFPSHPTTPEFLVFKFYSGCHRLRFFLEPLFQI